MSTPDHQLVQQLHAFNKQFNEAFNKNDASAMVPLFTEDAVIVSNLGPSEGLKAVEKYYVKNAHYIDHVSVIDPSSPHVIDETTMWATGSWTLTYQPMGEDAIPLKGYWSTIYRREGNIWKEQMQTWNMTP